MQVSARQSIQIFGLWDQPRSIVLWEDLKERELSWYDLRNKFGFHAEQLKRIQPRKEEWVMRGQLKLFDVLDMRCFPVNPFLDLGADLAEVLSMKWTAREMCEMEMTYEQMLQRGLTASVMTHFHFPLSGWIEIGLCERHVTTQEMADVFGMDLVECRSVLADFESRTVGKKQ